VRGEEVTIIDEKTKFDSNKVSKNPFAKKGLSGDREGYFDEEDKGLSKKILSRLLIWLGCQKDDNW